MKRFFSNEILCLLCLALLVFVLNLWGYPLFDVDEPRYAEAAREMFMAHGDWITPHFNFVVRFDKPVLFYWLVAAFYKVLGVSAFSARLVSALAAIGTVFLIYFFVKKAFNRYAGMISALIFMTMIEVFGVGRMSITDMTLTFFMAGAWLCFFMALTQSPRWFLLAGVFSGLGVLTKGPVALALPGITFFIALFWHHRQKWKQVLLSHWMYLGLGVFFAVAVPWYVAAAQANPNTFVDKFFLFHNVDRFTSTVSGHKGPWYYYIPVLLIGAFPWSLFIPVLIQKWFQYKGKLPEIVWYAFIWFWVVLLFFSFAGTKLLTYVLPAFPAFAIMMGWAWHCIVEETESPALEWIKRGLWLGVGLILAAVYVAFQLGDKVVPVALRTLYNPSYLQVFSILILIIFGGILFLISGGFSLKKAFFSFSLGMIVVLCDINLNILPFAGNLLQHDIIAFAQRAVADNMPIGTYRIKKPSLVFYTQRKVYHIAHVGQSGQNSTASLKKLPMTPHALYLVIKNSELPDFRRAHLASIVEKGFVYSLIQVNDPQLLRTKGNE